jgi:SOS-response transcriptional repressor LexA
MEPTLVDGDVLVVRVGVQPAVADLVVAKLPDDRPLAIKRVLRHDTDGWWLERDNPAEGADSWTFGAVVDSDVVAVVQRRIWPLRRGSPKR